MAGKTFEDNPTVTKCENLLNNSFVVNFSCEALSKASKLGLTSFMEKSFTHFPTPALPKAQSCFPQNGQWEKKKLQEV